MPDLWALVPFAAVFFGAIALAVYSEEKARTRRESQRGAATQQRRRSVAGAAATPAPASPGAPNALRKLEARPKESGIASQLRGDHQRAQPSPQKEAPAPSRRAVPSPRQKELNEVDPAGKWNERVFAAAPETHFMFQPIRRLLPAGIPTWYCPQLVINGRDAGSVYTANTDLELVVLQPVDSDENDPDDRLRTFLLPLSANAFQVLRVPICGGQVACRVLTWQDTRQLLQQGFRSVGRDDLIDYGVEIEVLHWSMRRRRRNHDSLYHSVAVPIDDARLAARCASGRVLNHVRKLRPRGSVRSELLVHARRPTDHVCLTFYQRYGSVNVEKQIFGRLLSYDEELERPPQWEGVIDVAPSGEVLRVYSPYEPILRARTRVSSRWRL